MNMSATSLDLPSTQAASRPRLAAAGVTTILVNWAARQLQSARARRQERATQEALSHLTDYLRRDIGMPASNAQRHVHGYY